jgi:hypothetical protein
MFSSDTEVLKDSMLGGWENVGLAELLEAFKSFSRGAHGPQGEGAQ